MAKNKAQMTVMSGKTLSSLIDLQQSTQDVLNKISASMQDAADKKNNDLQNNLLVIQQKLLDVNLDNFKLNKKNYDNQSKTFESLSKGMKDWKTWGDKLRDLKNTLQDKSSPASIQQKILKGLNIGGILNKKLLELDFKKTAKMTGTAPASKKELDSQARQFAESMIEAQRQNAKIERMKKQTGRDDDFLKNTPKGAALYSARDQASKVASGLQSGKSAKDVSNKMGGNTSGISVPLRPAEANPLTDLATGTFGKEGQLEQANQISQQTDALNRIAANTDIMVGKDQEGNKKTDDGTNNASQKGMLGSVLSATLDFFGDGFLTAIKTVFSVRSIIRVVSRVFAPAMLVGSLVNGIMDGFDTWKKSGSLSEALISGLGGILDFLSFGLFDKKSVRKMISAVNGFVNKYITEPISNLVNGLGDAFDQYIGKPIAQAFQSMYQWAQSLGQMFMDYVVTPIQTAIQPIADFFADMMDSVLNFLKNIEIPGISFNVPVYGDVAFGPWHPFDSGDTRRSADNISQAAPKTGQMINDASKNNADNQAIVDSQSKSQPAQTVNTAVQNNSSTTNVIKPAVRNQESSQSRYLAARY